MYKTALSTTIAILSLSGCGRFTDETPVSVQGDKTPQQAQDLRYIATVKDNKDEVVLGRKKYDSSTQKAQYEPYSHFAKVCVGGVVYLYSGAYIYNAGNYSLVDNIVPYVHVNPTTQVVEHERCNMEVDTAQR